MLVLKWTSLWPEAAKKDIGVGDTYKKYLDMAMQDRWLTSKEKP